MRTWPVGLHSGTGVALMLPRGLPLRPCIATYTHALAYTCPAHRRLAHQQGVLQEREQQQAALQRLGQQLAERDAQLADLHGQLRGLQQELGTATSSLQAAAAGHAAEVQGTAVRLEQAGRCARQLLDALRLVLETVQQMGAAVAVAAVQASAGEQVGGTGGTA